MGVRENTTRFGERREASGGEFLSEGDGTLGVDLVGEGSGEEEAKPCVVF